MIDLSHLRELKDGWYGYKYEDSYAYSPAFLDWVENIFPTTTSIPYAYPVPSIPNQVCIEFSIGKYEVSIYVDSGPKSDYSEHTAHYYASSPIDGDLEIDEKILRLDKLEDVDWIVSELRNLKANSEDNQD